jgi:molybdate transport repressor ModE-like protein
MGDGSPTLDLDLVWKAGPQPGLPVDAELFDLLDAIKNTGKLTDASERVHMPYRQSWGLINTWSERLGQPLVIKEQGRGTKLTELGERLLWLRQRIKARLTPHLESAASEVERELSEFLKVPNPALTMFASHDLVLTELRDFLRERPGPKLDIRFVGSLESVIALCKGRCELAGFHVPSGPLGRDILKKYEPWLKPRAQRVIHFVRRQQGLLLAAGNPLGIRTLKDIAEKNARLINRQRGSGTHLALQHMLQEQGIDPAQINGYYTEEFTHLAVAAAVASGVADVGVGIEAAARRLKLDFIPLFVEDYYLLGKRETIERADVKSMVASLQSDEFAGHIRNIPGYDISGIGSVSNVADVIG